MSEEKKKEENGFVKMEAKTGHSMVITVEGTGDRKYRFIMPFNSPLPECYNAAVNAANEIARIYNEEIEKVKAKAAAEAKEEEAAEAKEEEETVEG